MGWYGPCLVLWGRGLGVSEEDLGGLFLGILDGIESKSLLRGREVYVTLERKENNIEANCILIFAMEMVDGFSYFLLVFLLYLKYDRKIMTIIHIKVI